MRASISRCLVSFLALLLFLAPDLSISAQSSVANLKVKSSERALAFEVGPQNTIRADEQSVIVVVNITGVSKSDWFGLEMKDYWITAGDSRWDCLTRGIGGTNADGSPQNEYPLVFRIPKVVTSFTLHVTDKVKIPVVLTGPVKAMIP